MGNGPVATETEGEVKKTARRTRETLVHWADGVHKPFDVAVALCTPRPCWWCIKGFERTIVREVLPPARPERRKK